MTPRITDDDDINLDELDTELPQDEQEDPPENEPEEGDEPPGELPKPPADREPEPQEARGSRRIQALANENRDLRRNLNDAIQRFDDFVRTQNTRRETQETDLQRQQRRENMSPEEQIRDDIQSLRSEVLTRSSQSDMRSADIADKSAFDLAWGHTQVARKHSERIEQELTKMRKNGSNAPREVILAYLIGESALLKFRENQGGTQRKAAETRVRNATTRPGNAGSDSTQQRRENRRASTAEERLAGQPL